jgi:uncharacterized protein YqeY
MLRPFEQKRYYLNMNHKSLGEKTLAIILAQLLKQDKKVLLPFGDNQRYDLVIDEGGQFIRARCKRKFLMM